MQVVEVLNNNDMRCAVCQGSGIESIPGIKEIHVKGQSVDVLSAEVRESITVGRYQGFIVFNYSGNVEPHDIKVIL